MSTFRALDQLDAAVRRGLHIPLSGMVILDAERILSVIEKVRASLPEELRQARYLTQESQRILRESHEKSDAVLAEADRAAAEKVAQSQIMRSAQERAEELQKRTEQAAAEIREGADSYARDILQGLEMELERLVDIVRANKAKLNQSSGNESAGSFHQAAV